MDETDQSKLTNNIEAVNKALLLAISSNPEYSHLFNLPAVNDKTTPSYDEHLLPHSVTNLPENPVHESLLGLSGLSSGELMTYSRIETLLGSIRGNPTQPQTYPPLPNHQLPKRQTFNYQVQQSTPLQNNRPSQLYQKPLVSRNYGAIPQTQYAQGYNQPSNNQAAFSPANIRAAYQLNNNRAAFQPNNNKAAYQPNNNRAAYQQPNNRATYHQTNNRAAYQQPK